MHMIYPHLSYSDALFVSGLERLGVRREKITRDLFHNIQQPDHILHNLLSVKPDHKFNTRDNNSYVVPAARTKRYFSSYTPHCVRKRY
jgi:hypothetical protein